MQPDANDVAAAAGGMVNGRSATRVAQSSAFSVLLVLLAFVSLLWPLSLRGGPYVFDDSAPYLQGAATGFDLIFDWDSDLADPRRLPGYSGAARSPSANSVARELAEFAPPDMEAAAPDDADNQYAVSSARSPYFGGIAFLTTEVLGRWGLPIFNAISFVILALLTSRYALGASAPGALGVIVVGILTPAPFYVSFLMPDIFAGIAILGTALVFAYRDQIGTLGWLTLAGLITTACVFHTTHLLLVVATAGCGTAIIVARERRLPLTTLALVALACVLSLAAQYSFRSLVQQHYGTSPISPPFLAARVISDGPGYRYLKDNCGVKKSVFCDYIERMPGAEIEAGSAYWYSDSFLWSKHTHNGVFSAAPHEDRAKMGDEQFGFAMAVAQAYPMDVTAGFLRNAWKQVFTNRLTEFSDLSLGNDLLEAMGPKIGSSPLDQRQYDRFLSTFETVNAVAFWLSILLLSAALLLMKRSGREAEGDIDTAIKIVVSLVMIGGLANAFITGGLSGPHDRYQARILWLPVFALFIVMARWALRSGNGKDSGLDT